MRPREYDEVDRYVRWGLNNCQISRLTQIPPTTVRRWRHGARRRWDGSGSGCPICGGAQIPRETYAYLLGMYLGDGYLVGRRNGVYCLEITLDQRYPRIVRECAAAVGSIRPAGAKDAGLRSRPGCRVVYGYWRHWPCLFPQHGRGPKHHRQILLEPWQRRIVDEYPQPFLRGLIHSDGCRVINRIRGRYEYPRYQFTNHSADISSSSVVHAIGPGSRGGNRTE